MSEDKNSNEPLTTNRGKVHEIQTDSIALSGLIDAIVTAYATSGQLSTGALAYTQTIADRIAGISTQILDEGRIDNLPF